MQRVVFVNNLHTAANVQTPIGEQWIADKITFLERRAYMMPATDIVLGQRAPREYEQYIQELLGALPVAHSIVSDSSRVLTDGLREVAHLFSGANVYSYIGDARIAKLVQECDGRYESNLGGKNKAEMKPLAVRQGLRVPEGETIAGTAAIAQAVHKRLQLHIPTYVRDVDGGGGIGNRAFGPEAFDLSLMQIRSMLDGIMVALVEEFLPMPRAFPGVARGVSGTWFTYGQILRKKASVARWLPALPDDELTQDRLLDIGFNFREELGTDVFDVDLGVLPDGDVVFYEVNNRINGSGATVELVTRLFGEKWQQNGIVVRSMDDFKLVKPMNFIELTMTLRRAGLLARADNVLHKVIPYLPPVGPEGRGKVAGIVIIGDDRDYRRVQKIYEDVLRLIGDPDGNQEDDLA